MPFRCPSCRETCANLVQHYRWNPTCNRVVSELPPPPSAPPSTAGVEADHHFKNKFARRINLDYANLRYKKFIETAHCSAFHACAIGWIDIIFEAASEAALDARNVAEALGAMRKVLAAAHTVLAEYHSQKARDAYLIQVLKLPYIKPMPYDTSAPEEYRKFAAKLSMSQLIERLMQHDAKARQLIIAKSDEWMIGDKHNVRATEYADITDGWRCRSHPHLMRKANATEIVEQDPSVSSRTPKLIRIGIGIHNDDCTFANPIGTKRGEHKDSVTSCNILNLPLNMRHSFEYILLLSLVNSKTLKERGGLEWSMCGIDENGKESVTDSLAAEFRQCEFTFQLPDDDDLLGTLIPFRVQLYAMLAYCAAALAAAALAAAALAAAALAAAARADAARAAAAVLAAACALLHLPFTDCAPCEHVCCSPHSPDRYFIIFEGDWLAAAAMGYVTH